MEILNKNQRETAVWRLIAFGVLVLAANAFIMFASFKAFQDKGAGDANNLRKQLDDCINTLRGKTNDFQNEEKKLKIEIGDLKNKLKNKEPVKDALEIENRTLKTLNESLNAELGRCKSGKTN